MTQAELEILLNKYTEGTLNAEEQLRLDQWYLHQAKHGKSLTDAAIYEKRMRELDLALFFDQVKTAKSFKLWPRIATVAAAVAVIVFGTWFYNARYMNGRHPEFIAGSPLANDIAPGKNTATLTLANGKVINLSDAVNGELAKEAGVVITKKAGGGLVYEVKENSGPNKTNTLSTAKGETYQLRLPDGSMVWLNAASSLTYASSLNDGGIRRVKLEGEAYFEVAKDKKHPFIVSTNQQEVEVLGTHFNINSYADERGIKTTLLEGSVKVSVLTGAKDRQATAVKTLVPGQQAELNGSKIEVVEVNVENAIAWKNGEFSFNDEPLQSIMRKIARWYGVEVIYQDIDPNRPFGGTVSRFEHISKVLEKLELTGSVKFKITGKKVLVSK
jgi:transmembrane sensor